MKKERRGKQQPIFVLFLYSFANFAFLCVLSVNAFNAGLWPAGVSLATLLISLLPHPSSLFPHPSSFRLHPCSFILTPSSLRPHLAHHIAEILVQERPIPAIVFNT